MEKTGALTPPASKAELTTLREWLSTWGDGPNWSDPTGNSVPIQKNQLRRLLDHLDWLDEQVLGDLKADLALAWPVLQHMIEDEWPAGLIEALETWPPFGHGVPTQEQMAAVRRLHERFRAS